MRYLLMVIIFAGSLIYLSNRDSKVQQLPGQPPKITIMPTPTKFPSINYAENEYSYLIYKNISMNNLELYFNLANKNTSLEIIEKFKCQAGINGGFYGTDDKPVGWMVVNFQNISKQKQSQLFNGFVSIFCQSDECKIEINDIPGINPKYGLQSGPLLISNGQSWRLNMERDKPARRMVLGKTDKDIFILSVFDGEALISGPNLADLPEILKLIGKKENIQISDAINLDGGSASAFYSPAVYLTETTTIGSWWCIK